MHKSLDGSKHDCAEAALEWPWILATVQNVFYEPHAGGPHKSS